MKRRNPTALILGLVLLAAVLLAQQPARAARDTVSSLPKIFYSSSIGATEASYQPGGTVFKLLIQVEGTGTPATLARIAFRANNTADANNYITIPVPGTFAVDQIEFTGTIYYRSDSNTANFRFLTWSDR